MINFLEKFKKPKTSLPLHKDINPHRHWIIMLRVFFIISLLLIVFSLYLLYSIKNTQVFQAADVVNKPIKSSLKETLLDSVTKSLNEKDAKEASLIAHPLSYGDPSI